MRADSHIHLFEHGFGRDTAADAELEQYERLRTAHGIDRALVVGYEGDGFAGNNDYLRGLARDRAWIVPLAYLDLGAPLDAAAVTDALDGFAGAALYLDAEASSLRQPSAVWDAVAERSSVVSVNAPAVAWGGARDWAERLDCAVLVSHLGLPGPGARDASLAPVLALADLPHVHVKLSGAYAIDPVFPHDGARPAIELLLEAFGAERLVWGSDFSPALGSVTEEELFELPAGIGSQLSRAELDLVTGGTLDRLLGGRR